MSKLVELYGVATEASVQWPHIVARQHCPFLDCRCLKTRKSSPEVTIGTCTIAPGASRQPIMICPFRLLERRQIFMDCIHLLTLHQPGNELHIVPELNVPGGSIDYCLASVRDGKPVDFVGVELQTLDSTGTVWPERQRFVHTHGVRVRKSDRSSAKTVGLNWKMTAKTILVQLHHKIQTFEHVSKHLVLVLQRELLEYMQREFAFDHVESARIGDMMHFHAYRLDPEETRYHLRLGSRLSTDSAGIAVCLGLQAEPRVELQDLFGQVERKLSDQTLLNIDHLPASGPVIESASEPD